MRHKPRITLSGAARGLTRHIVGTLAEMSDEGKWALNIPRHCGPSPIGCSIAIAARGEVIYSHRDRILPTSYDIVVNLVVPAANLVYANRQYVLNGCR